MGKYPVKVVANGVDLDVFKRQKDKSIRKRYNIPENKKILLGVADVWSKRKGVEDFLKLGKVLSEEYVIVMVGMSRRKIKHLPENIIGIPHTENMEKLAELYSEAHIFINPSLEESFSLVTVEAMACGTPAIVLDTSAVKELITDTNGIILHTHECGDYIKAIKNIEANGIDHRLISKGSMRYSSIIAAGKVIELYNY